MTNVTMTHVYISRGVVSAWVETSAGTLHNVGHHPFEGWFCHCRSGKRCAQIAKVKAQVPVKAIEAGARGVQSGAIPAGVCTEIHRGRHLTDA